MIRVYLDWNVFSRLEHKDSIQQYLTILLNTKSKFLIPYSEAHLLDLYRSYKKVGYEGIEGHLNKIERYSNSIFLTNTLKDVLEFKELTPKDSMQQLIDAYDGLPDFNFSEILDVLDSELLDIQLPNPLEGANLENVYPLTTEDSKKLFGTKENFTFKELLKNLFIQSKNIIKDDTYTKLRNNYQKDIAVNTGKLNNSKFDPLTVLNENAQKLSAKNFYDLQNKLFTEIDNKSLFNKILATCRFLDFNGYASEDVTSGHHLDNVETDYKHIAYASMCDYFIISDKKTQKKAILVFQMLNIKTIVMSPKEFVEFFQKNQNNINNKELFINYLQDITKQEDVISDSGLNIYYLRSFILDYFNVVYHSEANTEKIYLRKYPSNEFKNLLLIEVSTIKNKLINLLGLPIHESDTFGYSFYAVSWLTDDLLLFILKVEDYGMVLEIQQCKKTSE